MSPTLYILYTADIPRAGPVCCDVLFADDVTQIIVDVNPSKRYLGREKEREINRINKYEETWKIQTNKNKFQLLSVSKVKPHPVIIENNVIPHTNKVQVLGLTIGRTGVVPHINKRLGMARNRNRTLNRFNNFESRIKNHLYKSLIR